MKVGDIVRTTIEIHRFVTIPSGTRLTIIDAYQIDRGRWLLNAVDSNGNAFLNLSNNTLEPSE